MKKVFTLLLTLVWCNLYASPYANPWLYDKMLDFIKHPSLYQDNFTNGTVENDNPDIIIGAFIENAYSVYEKEEEYAKYFKSCGDNCFIDENDTDILEAYHKFFYMFAVALPVSEILLQNPADNENISYYMQDKHVTYIWVGEDRLIINIDEDYIDFKKEEEAVVITSSLQVLKNYILN